MKGAFTLLLAVALALGWAIPARADYLSGQLVTGTNVLADDSIESYFDVNGNNHLSVGDVLAGVVKINNANLNAQGTHLYAVFSQQITAITTGTAGETVVVFGATTVPTLTLSALTGQSLPSNAIFAIYGNTAGYANDVLTGAGSTAVEGGPTGNIAKLMQYIANPTNGGQLELAFGPASANDFFQATPTTTGANLFTDLHGTLNGNSSSVQFATPLFGLSDPVDNTSYTLTQTTTTQPYTSSTPVLSDASLTNAGADGGNPNAFVSYAYISGQIAGAPLVAGGGADNGTVAFNALPSLAVPGPSSVILFMLGAFGIWGIARRTYGRAAESA